MQKPFVMPNNSSLKNGKKVLSIRTSPKSAPVAMTLMGMKKRSLAKKMKISDLELKIFLSSAEYFPMVSPIE